MASRQAHRSRASHHRAEPTRARQIERRIFRYGNRIMVPLLRLGGGRVIGTPLTGYFLLLGTTGCKSGQLRLTPLNYAIDGGDVVCLSGFGEQAHWLANIRADPRVWVRLPGRLFAGIANEVSDPAEARRLAVQVARNAGFALAFEHPRCLSMTDDQLGDVLRDRPVVRIQPADAPVVAGAFDPGGRGWMVVLLARVALIGGIALLWRRWCARATKPRPRR